MKLYFFWAVIISALSSSCQTADESFSENNNKSNEVQNVQQRATNEYNIYKTVLNSFVYDKQQSYQNNLIRFQQYVNDTIPNGNNAESIDFMQLSILKNADEKFINQLNCSIEARLIITSIIDGTFTTDSLLLITNTDEINLLNTLYSIHSDGNGNGDDNWKDRKTIAFAYGSQYNLTIAILYAGAIELIKYQD